MVNRSLRASAVAALALLLGTLGPACSSDDGGAGGSAGLGGSGGSAGASGGTGGAAGAITTGGSAGVAGLDAGPDSPEDASVEASPDVQEADSGGEVPLPGMGDLSGQCGELDDEEWNASMPFLFRNLIDFGAAGFVEAELSPGGAEVLADGNLNEGSLHSEVVAFEALHRCELATLIKSESEVIYQDPQGKKTDVLVWVDGSKVGVSVARAYHYPPSDPYTLAEATTLLNKKLSDIPLSAANADPQDAWVRSMLHVVAYDSTYADSIEAAWEQLDDTVRGDTIVVVTVTDGEDAFIY